MLLAAVLAVGGAVSIDAFWRARGHRPSITSDRDLWAQERESIYGPDKLVLVGGSRILLGFSFAESARLLPRWEPVQLAVEARLPAATLRDLSDDVDFDGVVIISMRAEGFERRTWDSQQDYIDYYHRVWNWSHRLDRWLRTRVEAGLVATRSYLGIDWVAARFEATGALPPPYNIYVAENRESVGAFEQGWEVSPPSRIRARLEQRFRNKPASPPDEWLDAARKVEGWIQRIRARGGRVALVRFPDSGEYLRSAARHYPRAQYWDRMAAETSAVTVHYADVAGMAAVTLPDHLHVGSRERDALTRALISELLRQGFFD